MKGSWGFNIELNWPIFRKLNKQKNYIQYIEVINLTFNEDNNNPDFYMHADSRNNISAFYPLKEDLINEMNKLGIVPGTPIGCNKEGVYVLNQEEIDVFTNSEMRNLLDGFSYTKNQTHAFRVLSLSNSSKVMESKKYFADLEQVYGGFFLHHGHHGIIGPALKSTWKKRNPGFISNLFSKKKKK